MFYVIPFPVYLFDVDGTLVHSAPDIYGAIQEVLRADTAAPTFREISCAATSAGILSTCFLDLLPECNRERSRA